MKSDEKKLKELGNVLSNVLNDLFNEDIKKIKKGD